VVALSFIRALITRPARVFAPQRVAQAAQEFMSTAASGGIVLLLAALAAMVWINSPWGESYTDFWHTSISIDLSILRIEEDLRHWVNEALMTLFFFVVGLEVKREIVHGELSDRKRASLPVIAAAGGMIVPALIFVAFNLNGRGQGGWGVPMATDIAFAVGVISILGNRVPFGVKILLLALAVADDVGAIAIIALFYTSSLSLAWLIGALAMFAVIVAANRAGVRNLNVYVVLGALMWVAMLESGVEATLAGVALGLLAPASYFYDPRTYPEVADELIRRFRTALLIGSKDQQEGILQQVTDLTQGTEAPLERLERTLQPWVSYAILPLFALANAGVALSGDVIREALTSPVSRGAALGLLIGKPVGIVGFTVIAVKLGLASLPNRATWADIVGVGIIGGIGFTVSLFIANLAFAEADVLNQAKIGVFFASILAGLGGFAFLRLFARDRGPNGEELLPEPAVSVSRH
jgi:Na+:H+ antiporter, NhaA family